LRLGGRGISYKQYKRSKASWIGHVVPRNYLVKHIIVGKKENDRSEGKTRKKTEAATECHERKQRVLQIERRSTRSHCAENWIWKRLWTCLKAYK